MEGADPLNIRVTFDVSLPSDHFQRSMRNILFAIFFVFLVFAATQAQTTTAATSEAARAAADQNKPVPLPADMAVFLKGQWTGSGKFSNGKDINADVEFSPVLDGQWLLYSHQDRDPGKYKALGMWGFERGSQKFVMIVQDNFGGTRRFESDGWKDGKVTFVNNVNTPALSYAERFTFERINENSFKISYETNRDGKEWRLGDYLIFTRKA